jgi:hypothetical protein
MSVKIVPLYSQPKQRKNVGYESDLVILGWFNDRLDEEKTSHTASPTAFIMLRASHGSIDKAK